MDTSSVAKERTGRRGEHRVLFPLWAKLGLLFGGFTALAVVVAAQLAVTAEVRDAEEQQAARLMGLADSARLLVDATAVAAFTDETAAEQRDYRRIAKALRAFRDANHIHWVGLLGRAGDRFHYLLDCSETDPYPVTLPFFDPTAALLAAFEGRTAYEPDFEDEYGVWSRAYSPLRDEGGAVVAALAADISADWQMELHKRWLRRVWMLTLGTSLLVLLTAVVFARYLSRGLNHLAEVALAVADGDLERRPDVSSYDEVGVLARIFDRMIRGLKERDFIRETFGRYVTPEVVRELLSEPDALRPGGDLRTVTILMSDLRGFTGLSERLPLDEMMGVLNGYLGRMADVVDDHGGTVNEFIGDAVLAVFGAPVAVEDHALRGVACAAQMQIELTRFNDELVERGLPELQMGIGLNTGKVIVGNIGSKRRMKYGLVGDAVNVAGRVESFRVGGEVLISSETHDVVRDDVVARGPIEVQAKGKKEPMRLYAVVSVAGTYDLSVPAEEADTRTLPHVMLLTECWRVVGKEVTGDALQGALVRLGEQGAELVLAAELKIFDNVRLSILASTLGVKTPINDVYAKVTRAFAEEQGHRYRIRFTSVPEAERERLEALYQVD